MKDPRGDGRESGWGGILFSFLHVTSNPQLLAQLRLRAFYVLVLFPHSCPVGAVGLWLSRLGFFAARSKLLSRCVLLDLTIRTTNTTTPPSKRAQTGRSARP